MRKKCKREYRDSKALIQATEEVVGYKTCRRRGRGTTWWTQEIKMAVEVKRKAYKKTLQRNVPEEVRERRKREYSQPSTFAGVTFQRHPGMLKIRECLPPLEKKKHPWSPVSPGPLCPLAPSVPWTPVS